MKRQDQTVTVTLVVKGSDPAEARRAAQRELSARLSSWFTRDHDDGPPFDDGSLLWYYFHVKGA